MEDPFRDWVRKREKKMSFEQDRSSFADALRQLRRRLAEKQLAFSNALGCSDAAISQWETGGRLPTIRNFHRLLVVVAGAGATNAELLALRAAWHRDKVMRTQGNAFPCDEAAAGAQGGR
jgi:DNA-binding transcriptional regulator YiaG